MSEAEFQEAIRNLCLLRHLACYHTHNSERSEPGFPDLTIMGETSIIFRELKTETGKVSEPQRYWLDRMAQAGLDVGVWRPSQLSTDVATSIMRMQPLSAWPPPKNPPRRSGGRRWSAI